MLFSDLEEDRLDVSYRENKVYQDFVQTHLDSNKLDEAGVEKRQTQREGRQDGREMKCFSTR